jgi:3',5'-cyclic AMP phosphodiesterase CpdA
MKVKFRIERLLIVLVLSVLAGCITLEGIPSEDMWHGEESSREGAYSTVTMPASRAFRIIVLADIQLTSNPFDDFRSLDAVRETVEKADPDLIVTVGDNVSWIFAPRLARRIVRLMESFEIPWAVTLGNHDSEGRADRYWHGNRYEEAKYSLFRAGPSNIHGVGNYGIELADSDGDVRYLLIMMDTNVTRRYREGRDYDFIYYDQIKWYEWMVAPDEGGKPVPSLLFFHIPLPEYRDAAEAWNAGEIDRSLGFGENREDVYSPPVNSGMFDALQKSGSTTHVFVGHDHVNNLSVEYGGIRLTYVLKTGPGSYSDPDLQGGTLVTIDPATQEVEIEHIYIRD